MRQNQPQQFKKKRQQYTVNIRRANRDEMITKRRNLQQQTFTNSDQLNKQQPILDETFRSFIIQTLKQQFVKQQICELVELMKSSNILQKHRAILGIKKLTLKIDEELCEYIYSRNIVKSLVEWSQQSEYLQIKLETLWVLTNLTSYQKKFSVSLVENQFLPVLIKILSHNNLTIVMQGIWISGNLAADDTQYRDQLISLGIMAKIMKYLEGKRTNSQICTVVWALTNLARGKPAPKYDEVKYAIQPIAHALKSGIIKSQSIQSDCLWTLANLSDGPKIRIMRVLQTNILPKLMSFANHDELTIAIPAMRTIGNFTTGNKDQTNQVLKNGLFDTALSILSNNRKWVLVKQLCWALSNVTAGTDEQILQFLQRKDLIQQLLQTQKKQNAQVKLQILWIFSNLQRSDIPEMILKLYQVIGMIRMIGDQLQQKNQKIILDALACLYRVLTLGMKCLDQNQQNPLVLEFVRAGYGPVLEGFQVHESSRIFKQSGRILERFFPVQQTTMKDVE